MLGAGGPQWDWERVRKVLGELDTTQRDEEDVQAMVVMLPAAESRLGPRT